MKGILFKEDMTKAIIAGTKTETRREIPEKELIPDITPELLQFVCNARARYKVGDIVYIKEPYFLNSIGQPVYRYMNDEWIKRAKEKADFNPKWKNKLFMPASVARYFIRIKDVKAERLLDITEPSAINEGIEELLQSSSQLLSNGRQFFDYRNKKKLFNPGLKARKSFFTLWLMINGYKSFRTNPWLFVYKFELLDYWESRKYWNELSESKYSL